MTNILIHDIATGEVIERQANETELANLAKINNEIQAETEAEANRAKLKVATIAKLGLTAEEVAALLS